MAELNLSKIKNEDDDKNLLQSADRSEKFRDESKVTVARRAFREDDHILSKDVHDHKPEDHKTNGDFIKDLIYGGLDGILEQFAVVSSVVGAGLPSVVAIILGFATLFADAVAMAFGDFISMQAEIQFAESERKREKWECDNYIDGEKGEMIELYESKGLSHEDAVRVVEILSKNTDVFVDFMMIEELGIMPEDADENPLKNAAVMFLAFVGFGAIPIATFSISTLIGNPQIEFIITAVVTGITLFFLGALMGKLSGTNMVKTGFQIFINGSVAASAAYLLGWASSAIIGK